MTRLPRPAVVQAAFYAIGGAWPLVAYGTFEAVTGRKREPWLVKTVAVLMLAIAAALAADPDGRSPAARRLGVGSAVAFGVVDVWYGGLRRRISPIYLVDAIAEAALVALWWLDVRRAREGDAGG